MGSLYGYEVESALPLERLNRSPGTRGELVVEAAAEPLFDGSEELVPRLQASDGQVWFASAETDGCCLIDLPPTCSLLLEPGSSRIAVEPGEDGGGLLEHRIASTAICILLAMRGDLALHGSAVESGGRAVVFCGPTGRGKSTLVRALGEAGRPVLGEDGIVISFDADAPAAFPGARGVRVRAPDGGRTLVPDPGPSEPESAAVGAVVILRERGSCLAVDRLEPARAQAMLTSSLIHSGGRDSIAAAFGRLARLLHSVPAYEASLPDSLADLPNASGELLGRVEWSG